MNEPLDHIVTGPAGDSQAAYPGLLTNQWIGQRVHRFRECHKQPTVICHTADGQSLWVPAENLKRVVLALPAVGVGCFWCGCSLSPHKDREVNDASVKRVLGHVLAVHENALKCTPSVRTKDTPGIDPAGFLRDRAPNAAYGKPGLVHMQSARMKQFGATTAFMCTEANVAACCVTQGWLEFNDDITGARLTPAGVQKHADLIKATVEPAKPLVKI